MNILDRFTSIDEKLDLLLAEKNTIQIQKKDNIDQFKQPKIDFLHVASLLHYNYYGFPYGVTRHVDYRGTSSTSRTNIISYQVPSERVALIRKIAIPYASLNFGTIKIELEVDSQNILGNNGVMESVNWIEGHAPLENGSEVKVYATELGSATQSFSAVVQIFEVPYTEYRKIKELFEVRK